MVASLLAGTAAIAYAQSSSTLGAGLHAGDGRIHGLTVTQNRSVATAAVSP